MLAKFFIDRPIFAWVIALFIIVGGLVSIKLLPIAQYPPVAPPTIVVTASDSKFNSVADIVAAYERRDQA